MAEPTSARNSTRKPRPTSARMWRLLNNVIVENVLVEYDDVEWHRREWLSIYKEGLFHFFLVEQNLVWADRKDPFASHSTTVRWPAVSFYPLVSAVDMSTYLQPIEFLVDKELAFKDPAKVKPFQSWETKVPGVRDYPEIQTAVRRWLEMQDGQRILLTTPSVLVGYRVEVYRAEGTTQWYTAVIIGYNESTRDLTVTDDTVLEEHNEDPALVQMRLIGDGVVESIMRGENVGITPRRSRSSSVLMQTQQPTSRLVGRGGQFGSGSGGSSSGTGGSGGLVPPSGAGSASRNHHLNSAAAVHHHHHHHHHHQVAVSRKPRATASKLIQQTSNTNAGSTTATPVDHISSSASLQSSHHIASSTEKGTTAKSIRKRKPGENDVAVKTTRNNNNASSHINFTNCINNKDDLENKQQQQQQINNKKKAAATPATKLTKKKVLEEAANNTTSKLRDVAVRVEDCLQYIDSLTTPSSGTETPSVTPVTPVTADDQNNTSDGGTSPAVPPPDLKPEPPPPVEPAIIQVIEDSIEEDNSSRSNVVVEEEEEEEAEEEKLAAATTNESTIISVSSADDLSEREEKPTNERESVEFSGVDDNNSNNSLSNSGGGVQLLTSGETIVINDNNEEEDNDDNNSLKTDALIRPTDVCVSTTTSSSEPPQQATSVAKDQEHDNDDDDDDDAAKTRVDSNLEQPTTTTQPSATQSTIESKVTESVVITEEEEDCVIVEPTDLTDRTSRPEQPVVRECSSRDDDDGPLSSSSPFSRMELTDNTAAALLRFPDDRSDSGVSSLRSGSCASGDERSGSRSSALSSSDEPQTTSSQLIHINSHSSTNRSPFNPVVVNTGGSGAPPSASSSEPVRVWRDPSLLLETEPHVRHIDSVQHQSLLMSHPQAPGAAASAAARSGSDAAAPPPPPPTAGAPAHLYPGVPPPPPPLLSQYPLHHHAAAAAAAAAHHLPLPDMLWKRYHPPLPVGAHLLVPPAHPATEELIERERAYAQDRERMQRSFFAENNRERREQEARELEKQHKEREKERDRLERERERQEREKMEREREKQLERERQDREDRERQEKQRAAEQAVHKHFEESLRLAHQKRGDRSGMSWNLINTLQPPQRTSADEERKRAEQEHQQREQQRQIAAAERLRHEARERAYYSQQTGQRPPSVPSKAEYPPPPAHSRSSGISKPGDKMSAKHAVLPQAEPNLSIFNYPAYQPGAFLPHPDPKSKPDHHKPATPSSNAGMVLGKSSSAINIDRDRDLVGPPPLLSELKNTVIVKHEGKSPHHLEQKVSHSPTSKLRASDMMQHYIPSSAAGQQHKSGLYEYRSPSQSPHHGAQQHPHTPSPHMHSEQKTMSHGHHRSSSQLPSPHAMQRQSPHPHPHSQQPHPSPPESRYTRTDTQMLYASSVKPPSVTSGYPPYLPPSSLITSGTHYTLPPGVSVSSSSKSKVNTTPPHIYGKPTAGIVSGIPVCRSQDVTSSNNPISMTTKLPPLPSSVSPSPYQQVSQYHPPQPPPQVMPATQYQPPPAHSSRTISTMAADRPMYERLYTGGSVPGLSVKPMPPLHGTSPPSAAAAPPTMSRSPHQHHIHSLAPPHASLNASSVQTQPLDLGVSSDRNMNRDQTGSPKRKSIHHAPMGSPIALEVKKRRVESPGMVQSAPQTQPLSLHSTSQPQLSRVSEPSPLIASAATTITTVVNTAAYCSPAATMVVSQPQPAGLEVSAGSPMVSITTIPARPPSEDAARPSSTGSNNSATQPTSVASAPPVLNNSPAPSPVPTTVPVSAPPPAATTPQPPNTPVKVTLTPSVIDSEKSNSPGPTKSVSSGNYPVRHLKKAWLQRHTGEDVEDTTGVTGTGSCVTLPLTLSNNVSTPVKEPSTPPSLTNSLHNIGSMAVNSINKSSKGLSNKGNRKNATSKESPLNGHATDSTKADDSSSSDQERGRKSPPKRKPPKVKRKKGGGSARKTAAEELKKKKAVTPVSESGSDSDKDTGSDKDSDSGASTNQNVGKKTANGGGANTHSNSGATKDKEPRKRGRRPKSSKNDKGEEPRNKKPRDEPPAPPRDPFRKPPVGQLKKTGESFLQDGPCFEVAPKLAKCRECRWTPNQRSKSMSNIFCRFYAFRRLRYTKNGQLAIAGFSDPYKDATEEDLKLWLPMADSPPADLDQEMSRFLLRSVGDQFCDLLLQEKDAHAEHMSEDKTIAWKRVVQGVREMCDVCETTLFNFHWACGKCGFVVCLDCYKGRKNGTVKIWGESGKDRDDFSWLLCTNRQPHEQEKLMLTQIIAGDSLLKLGRRVHEARELWNIPQYCECPLSKEVRNKFANGASKDAIKSIIKSEANGIKQEKGEDEKGIINGANNKLENQQNSPLSWLAHVALSNEDKKSTSSDGSMGFGDSDDEKDGNFSTLRELLIRPSHKTNGSPSSSPGAGNKSSNKNSNSLDDVISMVVEDTLPDEERKIMKEMGVELKHYVRRYKWDEKGREPLPIRIMTLTESREMYPDVPHSWLCDGKLLRLTDPNNPKNYKIFQDQWKRGQPVIVSDVTRNLNKELWHPDAFARDFGDDKNDLINCMTGNLVPNQPMRKFWEGFEHFSKRLKDERGTPMLLKLKDWPPGEDFAEMLPSRYSDLMKVLPLSEYTHRTGRLNLASRLPDCFVRPDLGPKMYNAYGSALYPTKGTTNLHLDVSDAVNVMVYVGIPKDGDNEEHIKEAFRAIDEAGCDILTRRRVRDKGELPGALWHIYHARDADKIRDLLNKVAIERGARLEPHHDPIHDQSCYLDGPLRERLYKEYNVEGYAIVQCLGDAVFIPAGAPHQVRNLHNCIKVAEDFVSPENVSHCFHLTQEFRALSDTHTNHEDKLQIKNIIYHAVKDSLSVLSGMLDTPRCKTEQTEGGGSSGGGGGGGDNATGASGSSSDTNSSADSPASAEADSKDTNTSNNLN